MIIGCCVHLDVLNSRLQVSDQWECVWFVGVCTCRRMHNGMMHEVRVMVRPRRLCTMEAWIIRMAMAVCGFGCR